MDPKPRPEAVLAPALAPQVAEMPAAGMRVAETLEAEMREAETIPEAVLPGLRRKDCPQPPLPRFLRSRRARPLTQTVRISGHHGATCRSSLDSSQPFRAVILIFF